jgi:general secretion pathway protein A
MYKEFYGFTTYPFTLTPDPQFLYPSGHYKECLYYLLYGIEREHGLLVLIGDIGTGKTFLLNTLVQRLGEKTHIAFLVNPGLDYIGILQHAAQELKLEVTGDSKAELLTNLKNFLLTCAMKNEKVILIIDEAQHLSAGVLEELRLLSNFENHKKLLQIVLSGQLQLEDTLKLPELTQLIQRVGFYGRLIPMSYDETEGYIEKRLSVAGVTYPVFTSKAIKTIFVHSKGVPRVINLICDLALLFGFIHGEREIGPTMVTQAMKEFNFYTSENSMSRHTRPKPDTTGVHTRSFRRLRRLVLVAGLVAFLIGAGVVLQSSLAPRTLREDTIKSGPTPTVVLPQQPGWRDQPLIPPDFSVVLFRSNFMLSSEKNPMKSHKNQ